MNTHKNLSFRIVFIVLCLSLTSSFGLFAQFRLDNWKTYTSLLNVTSAAVDSRGRIWAGTTGGIFIYDSSGTNSGSRFIKLGTNEGLASNDITAICADTLNKIIYAGTFEGYFEIISENLGITHITDIVNTTNLTNPVINDILIRDSLAYIGGGFGLTIFNTKQKVFVETVSMFGSFQQKPIVNKILIQGNEIWLATDAGIAEAELNSMIIDPQSWNVYDASEGLPNSAILSICFNNGSLYAITSGNLCRLDSNKFTVLDTLETWEHYNTLHSKDNVLYSSTDYAIYSLSNGNLGIVRPSQITLINGYIFTADAIIIFFNDSGIGIYQNKNLDTEAPNSPAINLFLSLDIDGMGALWAATDFDGRGKGFMKFENGEWTNFNNEKDTVLLNDSYYKISSDRKGKIFASNWGSGLCMVQQTDTGYTYKIFNNHNTPMRGIAISDDWVIAGQTATDSNGVLWITNYGLESPGPSLLAYKKDGSFVDFENCVYPTKRTFLSIAIDQSGTKWLGSGTSEPWGIMYFNENGTLDNKADDICGLLTTSNSAMLENGITSLAVDKTDALWIGFESGLCVMYNPYAVLQNSKPSMRQINLVGNQMINDIAVDALNNKWIATNTGVWVLNSDGTEVLAIITKENSKLVSDEVYAIKTNPQTGEIFFGTKKGLSVAHSLSIEPLPQFNIKCYPQPYDPEKDGELVIDGLAADASLKILTIDGGFINSLNVSGRKAVWDGRDTKGSYVSSGVYMIVASSSTTDAVSVGKFAVIRH